MQTAVSVALFCWRRWRRRGENGRFEWSSELIGKENIQGGYKGKRKGRRVEGLSFGKVLNSPFKMKMRDRQNCHEEIAERKERVDVARKQWAKCEAEKGKELRRWKMETEVEIKVHEREIAERLRRIEACKAEIREIEKVQKDGGYEGWA